MAKNDRTTKLIIFSHSVTAVILIGAHSRLPNKPPCSSINNSSNSSHDQSMDCPDKEAVLASSATHNQPSDSLSSSRTMSPAESLSEKASTREYSSSESDGPPTEAVNRCAQSCKGLWNGCSFGEKHEPHCRLRCSPRACQQCHEVIDADWIRRGRWLEDCVAWDQDGEHQHSKEGLPARRKRGKKFTHLFVAWALIFGLRMCWEFWSLPALEKT